MKKTISNEENANEVFANNQIKKIINIIKNEYNDIISLYQHDKCEYKIIYWIF